MKPWRSILKDLKTNFSHRLQASGFFSWIIKPATVQRPNLGQRGEELAAAFLRRNGLRILARGYASKTGEIDIIALDKRTLVFVEVKTWQRAGEGGPSDAVNIHKQRRITQTALGYLKRNNLLETPARFDVIQIVMEGKVSDGSFEPDLRHIENAFEATGQFQFFS